MIAATPHEAACQEILSDLKTPRQEASYIRDKDHLRELWQIDKVAYDDHSLEFEPFLSWWNRYPIGSNCILMDGQIVASLGMYPISPEQAAAFSGGQIAEKDLLPVPIAECETNGCIDWYFSGLVVTPEWQNRGLVRRLLRVGLGAWSVCGHLRYPIRIYGLGQTSTGKRVLEWFGMNQIVEGSHLPDGLDLHFVELESAPALRAHLSKRGI